MIPCLTGDLLKDPILKKPKSSSRLFFYWMSDPDL